MKNVDTPEMQFYCEQQFFNEEVFLPDSSIITLERGTCAYRAATTLKRNEFFQNKKIELREVKSFQNGVETLREDFNALLIVPILHEIGDQLSCDDDVELLSGQTFYLDNPPLYVAEDKNAQEENNVLASLEALLKLVGSRVKGKAYKHITAENTQEAARTVVEGNAQYCVTNENGIDQYDLAIVKELAHIKMTWHLYRLKRGVT